MLDRRYRNRHMDGTAAFYCLLTLYHASSCNCLVITAVCVLWSCLLLKFRPVWSSRPFCISHLSGRLERDPYFFWEPRGAVIKPHLFDATFSPHGIRIELAPSMHVRIVTDAQVILLFKTLLCVLVIITLIRNSELNSIDCMLQPCVILILILVRMIPFREQLWEWPSPLWRPLACLLRQRCVTLSILSLESTISSIRYSSPSCRLSSLPYHVDVGILRCRTHRYCIFDFSPLLFT